MEPSFFALLVLIFCAGAGLGIALSRKFRPDREPAYETAVRTGKSNISGRGVFAAHDISQGDIVERCPVLELDQDDIGGELLNYVFYGDDETKRLVTMGNGMLFNHSPFPNVAYYLEDTPLGPELVIYALRDIRKDEELFYNYGNEWWSTRTIEAQ